MAEGGLELPLVDLVVVIAVGAAGPGAISLDSVFGTVLPRSLAYVGVILVLADWIVALINSAKRPAGG